MTPLPPKQGLKLSFGRVFLSAEKSYDTTSTKTRIETYAGIHPQVFPATL